MSTPVKLCIYDLSNGIAKQISTPLAGQQFDGIWHTSVVVFGKEIFYGQGINITLPGQTPHGSPTEIIDMGETCIDEEAFDEYITAMSQHYTADKFHVLDFNCNTFTDACIGFLTGNSIPPYIKSLPNDFLSTPWGAAFRPAFEIMRAARPPNGSPGGPPAVLAPNPMFSENFLQSLAMGSPFAPSPARTPPPPDTPSAALARITTNPALFHNLLGSHRAIVAFFTSATCEPCRLIGPVFEELAKSKTDGGVGFAKIDLSVGLGGRLASEYQVHATPTFLFFLDGHKIHELKEVDAAELKMQVDSWIQEAFPAHAHQQLSLPAVEAIPLRPILFTQVPNLDALLAKLLGFIDSVPRWSGTVTQGQAKQTLSKTVLPFLKASTATPPAQQPKLASFEPWLALASSVNANLGLSELFPLVDIWRLALLDGSFAAWNAAMISGGPLRQLMDRAIESDNVPRNYLLTVLRMLANAFSSVDLAREVTLLGREATTKLLMHALLHVNVTVRTAGASLAFNIAAYLQRQRDKGKAREDTEGEEWEREMVAAILQAIEAEQSNEEIVHRLVASFGLLLWLSPYTEQLAPLLASLGAGKVLKAKVECGVTKADVRKLIIEVGDKLCP